MLPRPNPEIIAMIAAVPGILRPLLYAATAAPYGYLA